MAESEEELKSLLRKVQEESEKPGLKLNIQKTKLMSAFPRGWEQGFIGCEKSRPPSGAKRQPTGLFGSLYLERMG